MEFRIGKSINVLSIRVIYRVSHFTLIISAFTSFPALELLTIPTLYVSMNTYVNMYS